MKEDVRRIIEAHVQHLLERSEARPIEPEESAALKNLVAAYAALVDQESGALSLPQQLQAISAELLARGLGSGYDRDATD